MLNEIPNDAVSDTTDDDSSNVVMQIITLETIAFEIINGFLFAILVTAFSYLTSKILNNVCDPDHDKLQY
jgi:hypothetical protein